MADNPLATDLERRDRGMGSMLLLSAALHGLVFLAALVVPASWFGRTEPPVVSYTVDLVSSELVGGTNLVEGGRGRVSGQTMAAPPAAPPAEAERRQEEQVAAARVPPQPKPREEPEARAEDAVAVERPTTHPVRPTPTVTPPPQAVAKAVPPATPTRPQIDLQRLAQQTAAAEKTVAAAEAARRAAEELARRKAEEERKKAEEEARRKAEEDIRRKAEELARQKEKERIEAQIVAATRRLQSQTGERGAGTGSKPGSQPGGPISVGPGSGAGGTVADPDYVLYLGQLQRRLQENWAWAGRDDTLEAVVAFSITPSGDVVNVRIVKPSGDKSFDLSVERTVRSIHPMPPPPEKYQSVFADVEFTFNAAQMKQ